MREGEGGGEERGGEGRRGEEREGRERGGVRVERRGRGR